MISGKTSHLTDKQDLFGQLQPKQPRCLNTAGKSEICILDFVMKCPFNIKATL